jgi:hypothetical protein
MPSFKLKLMYSSTLRKFISHYTPHYFVNYIGTNYRNIMFC